MSVFGPDITGTVHVQRDQLSCILYTEQSAVVAAVVSQHCGQFSEVGLVHAHY